MKAFAALLDRLVYTPGRDAKLRLLADYFARNPDPDRGYALAALTGTLDLAQAKPALVRDLVEARVDAELFRWSYDFVGDLAETVSLIWPKRPEGEVPTLSEVVESLQRAGRRDVPGLIEGWLDRLDVDQRWALIKLVTGGLRVGVSARLARTALATWSGKPLAEIEEIWHGVTPPFTGLFAWLAGRGERPAADATALFRPLMLAHPIEDAELNELDARAYRAEWKWDGIRVQLVAGGAARRLYSRSGDDVSATFPEIVEAMDFDAVLDGELLVGRVTDQGWQPAPFNDLQQRLNRKTGVRGLMESHPAFVRLYDILLDGGEDLRAQPFDERRRRLVAWHGAHARERFDISPLIEFADWGRLRELRAEAREASIEGLMLKRGDSPYLAGRVRGPWFKWKRAPLTVDAVLMYAQRGHGKRSSFYSDFTFGVWRRDLGGAAELVPVGKAYFGFTDAELAALDRWVRSHTVERYGPVRAVEHALVLEIACDSVHASPRHKSGVAMRFPRVHRIRWDKPAAEADDLETVTRMVVAAS
ncbi:MAG: cisplatin damage response ATP-dependent DNA ligase [Alphaproteobacteria bacterium]|nr:cisplatin damage response ATP-dependent DNA ligase [Alphaproteobacteria bacterium]